MADVQGVPMVQRVWTHCMSTGLRVGIATDDADLAEYMKTFGAWVEMTSSLCATGTDRCAEFVNRTKLRADVICNVQCDMPFVPPDYILKAINLLVNQPDAKWSTLYAPVPLVVVIPGPHGVQFHRLMNQAHVGIYAFRRDTLLAFTELDRSENEISRDLEQQRLIDNNIVGAFAQVPYLPMEVNTPTDLELANRAA